MKWKYELLTLAIGIFVTTNFYLILKKDSEITRLNYVKNWTRVEAKTLVETKKATGVAAPVEEQHLYYHSKSGEFKQFLVKEGEEVEVGAALFEYSSSNIEKDVTSLQAEKSALENELAGIYTNISQLEALQQSLQQKVSSDKEKENKVQNEILSESIRADIYDKERQKTKIEGEIAKYDQLISAASGNLSTLTVNSVIKGTVKKVNPALKNPIITIMSEEQQIEGLLSEEEVQELTVGMRVLVASNHLNQSLEGTISQVSSYPVKESKKKSKYRYTIQLTEIPEEKLLYGSHVDLKIIKREAVDALTVPFTAVRKGKESYVYALEKEGLIRKRVVEPGMNMNQTQEIVGEIEVGDLVIQNPNKIKNESPFYTPLKTKYWSKAAIREMGKKSLLKSVAKGILVK